MGKEKPKPKPKQQHSNSNSNSNSSSSETEEEEGGRSSSSSSWCVRRARCLLVLFLSLSLLLSSVFSILPSHFHRKPSAPPHSMPFYAVDVVATFNIQRSVSELQAINQKLQYDIFSEIGISNTSVVVLSMEPLLFRPNWTNVVFGVVPYPTNSTFSSIGLSILRSYFASLFVGQATLHFSSSSLGNSSLFQVLQFPGGITIVPPQSDFVLQNVQFLLNFTLNFSIYQMQDKIGELRDQMTSGFHLSSGENLYFTFTNLFGSTVESPIIVQTGVVPVVGPASKSRLKELGQAINSSSTNLGLNHTVFGRVKQIHLSSYLQHSLNSHDNNSIAMSPSPAPQQSPGYRQSHNPGYHQSLQPPNNSSYNASSSGCQFGYP